MRTLARIIAVAFSALLGGFSAAEAQGIHAGGSVGEGAWHWQARERYEDRSGLPRWRGTYHPSQRYYYESERRGQRVHRVLRTRTVERHRAYSTSGATSARTAVVGKVPAPRGPRLIHTAEFKAGQAYCDKYVPVAGTTFVRWEGVGASRRAICE